MKYPIARYGLLILLIPFLISCQMKPEDKWPVITSHTVTADFTITAKNVSGIFQFTVKDRSADLKFQIRTYNANQGWKTKVILEGVDRYIGGSVVSLPITELSALDGLTGTYVTNSGHPPQGVVELSLTFEPNYFPLTLDEWFNGTTLTNQYIYHYRLIVEDMGGRTDTITFNIVSTLSISSST
jgi:hypothetical protein